MSKQVFTFDEPAVGTDAEVFLLDKAGNPVSAEGIVGGRKNAPIQVSSVGGWLEDNVSAEINILPVLESEGPAMFSSRIDSVLKALQKHVDKLELKVDITAARLFDDKYTSTEQGRESGCSPTFDAWKLVKNPRTILEDNWRFCGGDIHLSHPDVDKLGRYFRPNLARIMDMCFALNEIVVREPEQRSMGKYGRIGIHRPTSYGVEYKTIGNWWLGQVKWRKQVFNAAINCLHKATQVDNSKPLTPRHYEYLPVAREQWNKSTAQQILHAGGYVEMTV